MNNSLAGNSVEKILDLNTKILLSQSIEKENNNNNNNEEKAKEIYMKLNQDNNQNSSMRKLNDFRGTFGIDPTQTNNLNNINNNETQSNKIVNNSLNSNFTFGKNSNLMNSQKKNTFGVDSIIKNINMGALNYYSKYENNDEQINKNIENNNQNDNNENEKEKNQMEQSMQSVSKLISPTATNNLLSTWKKKSIKGTESIKEDVDNENEKELENNNFNNNFNYNNNYNNYQNNDYNNTIKGSQIKQSLAKQDLLMTFGEGGNIVNDESIKIKNNNETIKGNIFDKNKTSKFLETNEEEDDRESEKEENEEYEKEAYNKNYNVNNIENGGRNNIYKNEKEKEFLDFDNFCDIPNSNNSTLKFTMRKNNNNNEHLESEGICNIFSDTKNKNINFDMTKKVNDALKDAKDSSDEEKDEEQIYDKLNFFSETLGKGLKQNKFKEKNDKDINVKNEDMNMIISGEVFDMDVFKSGQSNRHLDLFNDKKNDNKVSKEKKIEKNLDESDDLKDSYCDTLLQNMEKFRNMNSNLNDTKKE